MRIGRTRSPVDSPRDVILIGYFRNNPHSPLRESYEKRQRGCFWYIFINLIGIFNSFSKCPFCPPVIDAHHLACSKSGASCSVLATWHSTTSYTRCVPQLQKTHTKCTRGANCCLLVRITTATSFLGHGNHPRNWFRRPQMFAILYRAASNTHAGSSNTLYITPNPMVCARYIGPHIGHHIV
jgi:hypothetical protein